MSNDSERNGASCDDEGTASFKIHYDCSGKKIFEFVCDMRAMVDSEASNSIKSIARDVQLPEFLIRQTLNGDILHSSYKMRMRQIFNPSLSRAKRIEHRYLFQQKILSFSNEKNVLYRVN